MGRRKVGVTRGSQHVLMFIKCLELLSNLLCIHAYMLVSSDVKDMTLRTKKKNTAYQKKHVVEKYHFSVCPSHSSHCTELLWGNDKGLMIILL